MAATRRQSMTAPDYSHPPIVVATHRFPGMPVSRVSRNIDFRNLVFFAFTMIVGGC